MTKELLGAYVIALLAIIGIVYILYTLGIERIKHIGSEYGLETLLVLIGLGNAETLHQYLITTGSPDTWQLIVAVYSTELLIVWATVWGTVGLCISAVMFVVSMISIRSVYGEYWIGHAYFSISLFCGAVGNYFRRGGGFNGLKNSLKRNGGISIVYTPQEIDSIKTLTIPEIKTKFNLSLAGANILRQMAMNNEHIDNDIIRKLQ